MAATTDRAEGAGDPPPDAPAGGGCGFGCAAIAFGAFLAFTFGVTDPGSDARGTLLCAAGGLTLLVAGTVGRGSGRATETAFEERLCALPLSPGAMRPEDFVWYEGETHCPAPLGAVHFDLRGLWMREIEHTGSGRNRRILRTDVRTARAWCLRADGTPGPEILLTGAAFTAARKVEAAAHGNTYQVYRLPAGERVSVVGRYEMRERADPPAPSVPAGPPASLPHERRGYGDFTPTEAFADGRMLDDGIALGAATPTPVLCGTNDLPLLATTLGRDAWIAHAETDLAFGRAGWWSATFLASACLCAGIAMLLAPSESEWPAAVGGAIVGLVPVVILRVFAERSRVERIRARAERAAADLETELAASAPELAAEPAPHAAERVAARIAAYDAIAGYHNRVLRTFFGPTTGGRPLPLQG